MQKDRRESQLSLNPVQFFKDLPAHQVHKVFQEFLESQDPRDPAETQVMWVRRDVLGCLVLMGYRVLQALCSCYPSTMEETLRKDP